MKLAVKVMEHASGADVPGERQQVGVLPWRVQHNGEMRILLITSRGRGRWIVPKGWPVKGYPLFVAASREAFEEAGVIGDILPAPVTAFRYQKILDDGSQAPCRIAVFGMNVRGTHSHWREKGKESGNGSRLERPQTGSRMPNSAPSCGHSTTSQSASDLSAARTTKNCRPVSGRRSGAEAMPMSSTGSARCRRRLPVRPIHRVSAGR